MLTSGTSEDEFDGGDSTDLSEENSDWKEAIQDTEMLEEDKCWRCRILRDDVGWVYEPLTQHIIKEAATFQLSWLDRGNRIPTNLLDESALIAAALCFLVIMSDISYVTWNWSPKFSLCTPGIHSERLADVNRGEKEINPAVDVGRYSLEEFYDLFDETLHRHNNLGTVRATILGKLQDLLYHGKREDEPYIFYVLCILRLVLKAIESCKDWTTALDDAAEELKESLVGLCHMFHLSTDNYHPLNSDFDIENYSSMINDNALLIEHYNELHERWEENKTHALIIGTIVTIAAYAQQPWSRVQASLRFFLWALPLEEPFCGHHCGYSCEHTSQAPAVSPPARSQAFSSHFLQSFFYSALDDFLFVLVQSLLFCSLDYCLYCNISVQHQSPDPNSFHDG
ncbi:hypothetical protein ACLMJK_004711 [Lecanora helva]